MRLVVISDTHGFHVGMPIPEGDVLVHCGDWTRGFGSYKDTEKFARWLTEQPHKRKIAVPGNHDHEDLPCTQGLFNREAEVLGKEPAYMLGFLGGITIDGVSFDGGPWMPMSGYDPVYAFERDDKMREERWSTLGPCDVLVTHCPPFGILDKTRREKQLGCSILRELVFEKIKPKYHLFGHVHESRGQVTEDGVTFVNASNCTRQNFQRDDEEGLTTMTMSIRDAMVFDI